MDLASLKKEKVLASLGIDPTLFPRALSFIDFANVNRWFDAETHDPDGKPLPADSIVALDLRKLHELTQIIGTDARFYYGLDPSSGGSLAFIKAAQYVFGSHRVFTKPIQQIRHDLTPADSIANTRLVHKDGAQDYVFIPKCNFDVEIAVDAVRLIERYDTICLFSGDSDFAALLQYLKRKRKKVVLIKGGRITKSLGQLADLKIEAHQIRPYVATIKRKPGTGPGFRG